MKIQYQILISSKAIVYIVCQRLERLPKMLQILLLMLIEPRPLIIEADIPKKIRSCIGKTFKHIPVTHRLTPVLLSSKLMKYYTSNYHFSQPTDSTIL